MNRRSFLLTAATAFVPTPKVPAPLVPGRVYSGPAHDQVPRRMFTGRISVQFACPFCGEMLVLDQQLYPHRCNTSAERERLAESMKGVELRYWQAGLESV